MKHGVSAAVVLVLSYGSALCQSSAVNWSAFDMGYAMPSSSAGEVQSVGGQVFVGASLSASARLESGFLTFLTATTGYPSNTGSFVVTTASDTGQGSLRWAIQTANTTPGLNIITFNIPGIGVHTITPLTALPEITDPVVIDGYSQPGSHPNTNGPGLGSNALLLIELNCTNVNPGTGGVGIMIRNGNCTIRGLVINRTPNAGVMMVYGSNNVIEGNFIGTDPIGTVAMGNVYGIVVETPGSNYRIGGTSPAARNVISGNTSNGIAFGILSAGGSSHFVQGNLIGTNAAGTAALPNGIGLQIAYNTSGVLVGGNTPGARNVISGNTFGISISGASSHVLHTRVQGNFIGTDVTGTSGLGNIQDGIDLDGVNTIIGGTTGEGNVISANGHYGLSIFGADSSVVQGNYIGTDVTGAQPLGNHDGGISLVGNDLMIGGATAGAGNTIMFNGTSQNQRPGVGVVGSSYRIAILGNSIYSNAGLGIDLGNGQIPDGVTPNDSCDVDTLIPNNGQNYPVLTSVVPGSGTTIIQGTLNSRPGGLYRIEFFASPSADSTGYGEGKTFLGFTTVATNSSCTATFVDTLAAIIPFGTFISATATDASGNTSEFSKSVPYGTITTSVRETQEDVPETYALSQKYPNPFNPNTTIRYALPAQAYVTLKVYNILGQEVTTLIDGPENAGYRSAVWNAGNMASGVYVYRLTAVSAAPREGQARQADGGLAGRFTQVRKMLLLK